jgi:hypothetical protein
MARFTGCDFCGVARPAPHEFANTRPSDPMSLVCVMAICDDCHEPDDGTHTLEEWSAMVENGEIKGVAFYE